MEPRDSITHRPFGKELTNLLQPSKDVPRLSYFHRKDNLMTRGISEDMASQAKNLKFIRMLPDASSRGPSLSKENEPSLANKHRSQTTKLCLSSIAPSANQSILPVLKHKAHSDTQSIPKPAEGSRLPSFREEKHPQFATEYFSDNIQHMLDMENVNVTYPMENYFGNFQKDITKKMREIVLDWLVDLHLKYRMFPQTLFLVVAIIDKYLTKVEVPRSKLQLVASAAFFIAAKYEQTYEVPLLSDLVSLSANAFTAAQVLSTESSILKVLDFNLVFETSFKFFEPLALLTKMEPRNVYFCRYVLELAMYDCTILFKYKPSVLATSALYLVNKIRRIPDYFPMSVSRLMGLQQANIRGCAKELCYLLENAPLMNNTKYLKRKFSQASYYQVSKLKLEKKDSGNSSQSGNNKTVEAIQTPRS